MGSLFCVADQMLVSTITSRSVLVGPDPVDEVEFRPRRTPLVWSQLIEREEEKSWVLALMTSWLAWRVEPAKIPVIVLLMVAAETPKGAPMTSRAIMFAGISSALKTRMFTVLNW